MWKTSIVTVAIGAVLAFSASAVAPPPDNMPDEASYGLCTAWGAMGGNDNPGNAPNAPPFQWLQDQAEEEDQSVDEWCAVNGQHPGGGNGGGNGGGPPENPGQP